MMAPPVFQVVAPVAAVQSIFGSDPVRVWPFGEAPEGSRTYPYATWQTLYGNPLNKLSGTPDMDYHGAQVDVWAKSLNDAREGAKALRDALEPHAYIVRWNGETRDKETRTYRYSFDVDFHTKRT